MLNPGKKNELIRLVRKVLSGKATQKEKQFVEKYYQYFDRADNDPSGLNPAEQDALEKKMLQNIDTGINGEEGPVVSLFKYRFIKLAAAAAVFIAVSTAVFLYGHLFQQKVFVASNKHGQFANNIATPGNTAVLYLANGSEIILDSARNGMLANQGPSRVLKINNKLVYKTDTSEAGKITYNIIATGYGRQYELVLGDGTKVWLNAGSSLKFPAAFAGKERKVSLSGEAYFEVTENTNCPFKVQAGGMEIEELGTHFNVKAYGDEETVTATLLEGAVKVSVPTTRNLQSATYNPQLIHPGEQAVADRRTGGEIKVSRANIAEVMAWKNGLFSFHRTDIYEVMRQLSRWYGVEVGYKDSMRVLLTGDINRTVSLQGVTQMLEFMGEVKFAINGKKVIVMKHR